MRSRAAAGHLASLHRSLPFELSEENTSDSFSHRGFPSLVVQGRRLRVNSQTEKGAKRLFPSVELLQFRCFSLRVVNFAEDDESLARVHQRFVYICSSILEEELERAVCLYLPVKDVLTTRGACTQLQQSTYEAITSRVNYPTTVATRRILILSFSHCSFFYLPIFLFFCLFICFFTFFRPHRVYVSVEVKSRGKV